MRGIKNKRYLYNGQLNITYHIILHIYFYIRLMTNKNILFFCIETNRGESILKSVDLFDYFFSNVQFEV